MKSGTKWWYDLIKHDGTIKSHGLEKELDKLSP
jgi:hypothetical protein